MHTAIATLIGVSVSLLVNAIDAIGINILRRDHVLLEARPHGERRPFYRRPKWLLGMSLHSLVQAVGGPIQFRMS